ncbi:MAG: Maf family protein [Desulfosporosinus sp.]|jgi:septum formation protein
MLVLASSSPRRAMLLSAAGYTFRIVKASVSEELPEGIAPESGVRELAVRKAQAGLTNWLDQGGSIEDVIMGVDTMVVLDTRILGKPETQSEAEEMLQSLSGRTHVVLTGVALVSGTGRFFSDVVKTIVHFRQLSVDEIKAYVADGEAMDKAGAYGIQGEAGKFVDSIEGSLTNVIGLPMEYLPEYLRAWGIEP